MMEGGSNHPHPRTRPHWIKRIREPKGVQAFLPHHPVDIIESKRSPPVKIAGGASPIPADHRDFQRGGKRLRARAYGDPGPFFRRNRRNGRKAANCPHRGKGITVARLIEALCERFPDAASLIRRSVVSLNQEYASQNRPYSRKMRSPSSLRSAEAKRQTKPCLR